MHNASAVALWGVLAWGGLAQATVTRVVVSAAGPMGVFEGREYLWSRAMMEGTVARDGGEVGQYWVPVTLMYPNRPKAYLSCHQTPSYRQYELAGVARIPPDIVELRLLGATRQNPVSFRPVFKAMLRHLVEWIVAGSLPPDSRYIAGDLDSQGKFNFATDADAPFSAEALAARYPSREAHVALVRNAAAALLAERFILQEDYDAYITAAQRWR